MLTRVLLGVIATSVAMGTAFLVLVVGRDLGLAQMSRGDLPTPAMGAELFGLVFIVVGAGAAVLSLIRRMFGTQRQGSTTRSKSASD